MDKVLDTEQVKASLNSRPTGDAHADEFCRLLALRLPDKITPLGFLMAWTLLSMDMERAGSAPGSDPKKIGNEMTFIAGLPIGGVLNLHRKRIVEKVFPADFASDVMSELEGVYEDIRRASVQ